MKKYVLGIDQSTQGTKGIIFDGSGKIIARTDLAHDQIINEKGWVEHNPDQIMKNVIQVVKNVVEKAGIDKEEILTLGISNQRETAVCWNKNTGRPVYNAIVWQCAVVKQSVTRLQRTVTHRWYRNIPEFRCLHIILQQRSHGYFRTYQKQKRQQIRENLQ